MVCSNPAPLRTPWKEDAQVFLQASPLKFKYHTREKFFQHLASYGACDIGLNIALAHSQVELILVLKVAGEHVGGTVHGLALDVGRWRDADFAPNGY